jgi:integrase
VNRHGALRRILRWLWEEHGAPKLDTYVPKLTGMRPRNVTADRAIIDRILNAARPDMRLWLLLCSDLGIRSGTALRIAPENYNQPAGTLSFTTKKAAALTLPVTGAVADLLDSCDLSSRLPFVTQLRIRAVGNMGRPRKNATADGHNLRQSFLGHRNMQATIWYLDHDLQPLDRAILEEAKKPFLAWRKEYSA